MKNHPCLPTAARLPLLVLGLATLGPALRADEPAASAAKAGDKAADTTAAKIDDYRTSPTELNKVEVQAALAQIDAELDHLDNLADAAPTVEKKNEVKAHYAALKQRRADLQKTFTRARYEAFKADLKAETDRIAAWTRETFATKPAAAAAASAGSAAAEDTAAKLADYRTEATDANKAEVKAALARLDANIDLLEARIKLIADAERRAELNRRLQALRERRSDLNREFRQARYDALVDDVKAEWNRLTN